jgi:hypothetical protein
MTTVVPKGMTVTIRSTFVDADGQPAAPTGATARFSYQTAAGWTVDEVEMEADGNDWLATWESATALHGRVDYHLRTEGASPIVAYNGYFSVEANKATP